MDIFRNLKTFLYNHRTKFLASGLFVGGSYALFYYFRQHLVKRQHNEFTNFFESLRRERHFETIKDTCDQTIDQLCQKMTKRILHIMNIDQIVLDLKNKPVERLNLWEDLKISTFTQICLMVYGQIMIIFILKLQFAIMGGYMYNELTSQERQISRILQEKYLSLCENFMKNGLSDLYNHIRLKVTNVITGLDLQKKLTMQGLADIFWSIQSSIDSKEFIDNIPTYLLLESLIDETNDSDLKLLYEETVEILNTKELTFVCINSLIHVAFTNIFTVLKKYPTVGKDDQSIPTAKLLPILHNAMKSNTTDETLCRSLKSSEKLNVLSANIYESYC